MWGAAGLMRRAVVEIVQLYELRLRICAYNEYMKQFLRGDRNTVRIGDGKEVLCEGMVHVKWRFLEERLNEGTVVGCVRGGAPLDEGCPANRRKTGANGYYPPEVWVLT